MDQPAEAIASLDPILSATADVAKRLSMREVWEVPNNTKLNFRYLDREIARSKPAPKKPPDGKLLVGLFLANASDRTPILCEMKIDDDQCPLYALIQLLTQAMNAATPAQRERLVLFGSQPSCRTTPSSSSASGNARVRARRSGAAR